jgi:Putative Ig domain/IPT/TIG domain
VVGLTGVLILSLGLGVSEASTAGATGSISVSGLSVSHGPASGGTSMTIEGSGFTGATAVSFGSGPAASFSVTDDNDIAAVAPQSEAGTVDVTVSGPDGTSLSTPADQFTATAVPPTAPQSVSSIIGLAQQLIVTWQPPAFDGGSPITSYKVALSRQPHLSPTVPPSACGGTPVTCTATIMGLSSGAIFASVVAVNAAGTSTSVETNSASPFVHPIIKLIKPSRQMIISGGPAISVQVLASTNDDSQLTYAATGLPQGLSIGPTNGLITGTPTQNASRVTPLGVSSITVNDGFGATRTTRMAWLLVPAIFVQQVPTQKETLNVATVPFSVIAADFLSGDQLTYSASGLPPGIGIDPTTGTVSGVPTSRGPFTSMIVVTDTAGQQTGISVHWNVAK